MKKIEIEFTDNYYSFKKSEKFLLNGDFIILSGLNGTGKTQLLNAMAYPKKASGPISPNINETKKIYVASIKQDNQLIKNNEIKLLNFWGNLKYRGSFPQLDANSDKYKLDRIYNFYISEIVNRRRLFIARKKIINNIDDESNLTYLHNNNNLDEALVDDYEWKVKLIRLIKNNFPVEKWYLLTKDEIKEKILHQIEAANNNDMQLLNHIASIFRKYAIEKEIDSQECINFKNSALNKKQFDSEYWKREAPWTQLNSLFEKLNFKYHFLTDYQINVNDGGLKNQIILKDKDSNEDRHLFELSDGEKTLLDLALTSFDFKKQGIKLVLFDEYDAFLNPSMIDKILIIFKEFFKDVQIIFVTHSLTTMFTAKESACFYEMFFKDGHHKIERVSPEAYCDIKHFLESLKLNDRLEFLKCKLCIVSEGQDNKRHIDHILKKIYCVENINNILVWNGGGKDEFFTHFDIYKKFGKKLLFVWDPDARDDEIDKLLFKKNIIVDNKEIFKYKFQKNNNNPLTDKGIENLYDKDMIVKVLPQCINNGKIDKCYLSKNISKINVKNIFKKFEPFVNEVKKILE